MHNQSEPLMGRIEHVRQLSADQQGSLAFFEAASLAMTVLHDTVGGGHPLMFALKGALEKSDWTRAAAGARGVVRLFDEGGLTSPRLIIAHEIEGGILDIAQAQVQAAETAQDTSRRLVHLGIAAFLGGAALEDVLRRLCDASGIAYDTQHTSISKLQAALFQPSKQIELISSSENKQLTAWGDTRNKADHGKFEELTQAEVLGMVIGVRSFIDKHLP